MRSNVETRRCGCGLILGLREGCQRCADAARAKLHAQGVATHDWEPGWAGRIGIDRGKEAAQDEARTQRELDGMCGINSVMRGDDLQAQSGLQHLTYDEVAEYEPIKYVKEFVGGSVSRAELDRAMGKLVPLAYKHEPPLVRCECPDCRVRRMEIEPHHRAFMRATGKAWTCSDPRGERDCPEPPPVVAEVSYDVALEDMKRRPEARYSASQDGAKIEYRFHDKRLLFQDPADHKRWVVSVHGTARHSKKAWTRLPDATTVPVVAAECDKHGGAILSGVRHNDGTLEITDHVRVPAIGAEVSWEVAKADMMARPEARYTHDGDAHGEFRLDGGVMWARERGSEEVWYATSGMSREHVLDGWRWTRLR